MTVSVACCLYNGERYLERQLASIAAQSVLPDEIVIVDDGSTDGSVDIAHDFARRAPASLRVVVERNARNLGLVANFEKAIARTSGDLIFLCDQDDVWHPSKVATMRRQFDARPDLLLLFTDARLIDGDGVALSNSLFDALEVSARERRSIACGSAFAALIARNLVTGATTALRRSAFEAARPFPREWIHDEWLAIVAAAVGVVDCVDDMLIDYRQHDANQIGARRPTVGEKFARLSRPRADRYFGMRRRAELLLDKLRTMTPAVPPARIDDAIARLAHVEVRAALPAARPARLRPIAREVATGRYRLYSRGFRSILQDCFEPP